MFTEHKSVILEHAQSEAPNECLGVIYDGQYIPLTNVHPDPENHFQMSSEDAEKYMGDPKLQAIAHSHPPLSIPKRGQEDEEEPEMELVPRLGPSEHDMKSQIASGVPWIIAGYDPRGGMWHFNCWGDHTLDLPILGRPFVHGIEDCYTLIRKWWWQNKEVKLSEYPRNDFWWTSMEDVQDDLYVKNFETEGFQQFWPSSPADLQPGDVFLFKLASKQYNHGGVFDGNGLIQHHAPGRLSEDTPVGPYFRRIDMWLRRDG